MDKDFHLIELFGLYGNMLTERQKDLFSLYYECDLSLGEIAQIKGVSRQSVNDGLKKSKEVLISTEEKLGLAAKLSALKSIMRACKTGEISSDDAVSAAVNILEEF